MMLICGGLDWGQEDNSRGVCCISKQNLLDWATMVSIKTYTFFKQVNYQARSLGKPPLNIWTFLTNSQRRRLGWQCRLDINQTKLDDSTN